MDIVKYISEPFTGRGFGVGGDGKMLYNEKIGV